MEQGFPNIDSVFPDREKLGNEVLNNLSANDTKNKDFIIQIRKYLANVHNQHTTVYLKTEFENIYPFYVFISDNDWYLINIDKKQDSLYIGKKIDKINGTDIHTIEKRLMDFTFAENRINKQYRIRINQFCNKPEYLKEIGIIKKLNDTIKITFTDSSLVSLVPVSNDKKLSFYKINYPQNKISKWQNRTYSYKIYPSEDFGYLQFNNCHDKIDILDAVESYVKPWLQPVAKNYLKRQFKKEKPSKKLSRYYNPEYPVFSNFIWELTDSLNNKHINNLIIDLRNNSGGNLTLGIQLMYFLTNKTALKGFREYAYTSDIYKSYFPSEYQELKDKCPDGVPPNKLVLRNENIKLFNEITNKNSMYYVPENRPIFKGNVYVLANYRTGSAAAILTTLFQDNELATVIGTSVANNPIGATTYTPMKLPKTKAKVSIATTYRERPKKEKGKIQLPDYWIEYSINDLATGNDPYLEKVNEIINKVNR